MYLFMAVLGLCCCVGFSLGTEKGGYSPVAVQGLLIAVASLVAEHGLWGSWALVVVVHRLSSCSSCAQEHRLNSCGTRAYFAL